ncbi:hypothetical protein [Exiguobacterium sp. BMC-KP]|nr:hypothetical protein [Exiguobacterium sp. BMC-KP]
MDAVHPVYETQSLVAIAVPIPMIEKESAPYYRSGLLVQNTKQMA